IRAIEYFSENKDISPPEFYYVKDSTVKGYDLSEIHNNYYSSKDELKESILTHIKKSNESITKMPSGINSIIDGWKNTLSEQTIDDIRIARHKTIASKFTHPVKVHLNKKWTLEYDIALSKDLRAYFSQAVEIAKRIKTSESYFEKVYDETGRFKLPEEIELLSSCEGSDAEIAYEIFKPFVSDNKPSKAVTAQVFSEILLSNKNNFSEVIKKDTHLEYIVDAIKYACNIGDSNE
ncbi:hypothetical protein, partial [Vibrio parahaemolyticus]|uniref:hypothetical protein n=1 Tax=Vibrio parahaemolyticus TaxID=670 RepID=UPI001167A5DD